MERRRSTQQYLTQLAEIARALLDGSLEDRLTAVVELAPKALALKSASIFLVGTDPSSFSNRLAPPGVELIQEAPRPEGLTASVLRTGRLLAVEDATENSDVNPRVLGAGIRSFIAVPLMSTGGCLGVMYLNHSERRDFSAADLRLADAIGGMVGQAVENARLHESEQEARRALEVERQHLASLTAALHQTVVEADVLRAIAVGVAGQRLPSIMDIIVEQLRPTQAVAGGAIMILRGDRLVVEAVARDGGRELNQRIPRANRPLWQVIEGAQPVAETRGRAAAPMRWQERVFGLLELSAGGRRSIEVPHINLLRKVAEEIAGWAYLAAGL